jgi:hypothetical protein
MKKIFKLLIVLVSLLVTIKSCYAEEYKILVLPDNLQFETTNYYVYPDSSTMFASDTINYLKQYGKVETVSMGDIRDSFRKNQRLRLLSNHALKEYKYNYNVSFVDLKKIASSFSVDKVLLISSTTDIQNYMLRRTVWDFLNIPGAAVIDPAYKLSTHASLIDVTKEQVLWQQTYYKKLTGVENRIIPVGFAPASIQLEKINQYSSFLSADIAQKVQFKILPPPPPVLSVDGAVINSSQWPTTEELINSTKTAMPTEAVLRTKSFVSKKTRLQSNGVRVNDL